MKPLTLIVAALCCPLFALCQDKDISGLWKGSIYNDNTRQTYQYEIFINKDKGKYTGYSETWYTINNNTYYGIKKLRVSIARDGKVVIQDAGLVENNYPEAPPKNIFQLNVLDFSGDNAEASLKGPFVTNRTKQFDALSGQVNLKKVGIDLCEGKLLPYTRLTEDNSDVSIQ